MLDYQILYQFLWDGIQRVICAMEQEADETRNLVLQKYVVSMHRLQVDAEEMELKQLIAKAELQEGYKTMYFHLFNLVTDMIRKLDTESESFIVKKHMLSLQNVQRDAEDLYLEQTED